MYNSQDRARNNNWTQTPYYAYSQAKFFVATDILFKVQEQMQILASLTCWVRSVWNDDIKPVFIVTQKFLPILDENLHLWIVKADRHVLQVLLTQLNHSLEKWYAWGFPEWIGGNNNFKFALLA